MHRPLQGSVTGMHPACAYACPHPSSVLIVPLVGDPLSAGSVSGPEFSASPADLVRRYRALVLYPADEPGWTNSRFWLHEAPHQDREELGSELYITDRWVEVEKGSGG